MSTTTDPSLTRLWELMRDVRFAMLTSHAADGSLRSRPLTTQNDKSDRGSEIFFLINASSTVAADVATSSTVNVGYASPDKDVYVSVSGEAAVVHDAARLAALWTPADKAWFPGGLDDPELRLLKVKVRAAEYWDIKSSKVVQMLEIAKAAVTGTPVHDDGMQHRKVNVPAA